VTGFLHLRSDVDHVLAATVEHRDPSVKNRRPAATDDSRNSGPSLPAALRVVAERGGEVELLVSVEKRQEGLTG